MVAEKIYDLLPQKWPLTIGDLPSTSSIAVGIIEYDGATSTEYFSASSSERFETISHTLFNSIVKIVVRHESYSTGQSWSDEVKEVLHRYHNEYDGILSCLMIGSPIYLGRNEQKLHEFQITFNISTKE